MKLITNQINKLSSKNSKGYSISTYHVEQEKPTKLKGTICPANWKKYPSTINTSSEDKDNFVRHANAYSFISGY